MAHVKYIQTNHRYRNCVFLISHISFGTPVWPMYAIVSYVVIAYLVYIYVYLYDRNTRDMNARCVNITSSLKRYGTLT